MFLDALYSIDSLYGIDPSTCTLCVTGSWLTLCGTGCTQANYLRNGHSLHPDCMGLSHTVWNSCNLLCVEQAKANFVLNRPRFTHCATGTNPLCTLCVLCNLGRGRLCVEQAKAHSVCNTNKRSPGPLCVEQARSVWYRPSAVPLCVVKTHLC